LLLQLLTGAAERRARLLGHSGERQRALLLVLIALVEVASQQALPGRVRRRGLWRCTQRVTHARRLSKLAPRLLKVITPSALSRLRLLCPRRLGLGFVPHALKVGGDSLVLGRNGTQQLWVGGRACHGEALTLHRAVGEAFMLHRESSGAR
jgi:hypothetical protein